MSCKTTSRHADAVSSQNSRCWSFLENSRHHKTCYKNYGTGSGMAMSSPFPVPKLLLLWQELHRPPCKREQEHPQCLVTSVPTLCHLPRGWREPLAGEAGELGPLCVEKSSLPAVPCLFYRRPPEWSWILSGRVWQRAPGTTPVSRASSRTAALGAQ